MKKIFTLSVLLVLCAAVRAQDGADGTFQFVDASGNVVADGTTITVTELEDDGFGGQLMRVPLRVRNVSGQRAAVSMYETIDALPNGTWQTCAFGNCMVLPATGYSPKSIVDGDYEADIQTEWLPDDGATAWEATLQIHVFNIVQRTSFGQLVEEPGTEIVGYGPRVTVRFQSDLAGIREDLRFEAEDLRSNGAVYDLQGRRIETSNLQSQTFNLQKGLYIRNGRKQMVK